MRTIWVTSVSPCPPTDGNRQRHLNLLTRIAAEHEVTLVCPVEGGESHELDALREICANVIAVANPGVPVSRVGRYVQRGLTLARRRPDCIVPTAIADMSAAARDEAARRGFDVAFGALSVAPALHVAGAPSTVIDDANVEADVYRRLMTIERWHPRKLARLVDWRQVAAWERRWLTRGDAVTVCSATDAQRLLQVVRDLPPTHVIPNGVDVAAIQYRDGPREAATVAFVGGMAYAPNTDAALRLAREVMPRIWAGREEAHLLLVGKDPPPEVRAVASSRIHVTGEVPSVGPYLDRATLAIVPLRAGGGTRLKILEAMAAGVPVVTTSVGAEGLGLEHDRDAWIGESDDELSAGVLSLLSDPPRARALARAARARVERDFGWDEIALRLERVLTGQNAVRQTASR